MRKGRFVWLLIVSCALAVASSRAEQKASSGEAFVGAWTGTWDGSGSGNFDLILDKKAADVVGRVEVTTDGGNYTADLKEVSFSGKTMKAKYDFPLDPSAEVGVSGTFDDRSAKGTWSLHPKGQDAEVAGGSWTVTRK